MPRPGKFKLYEMAMLDAAISDVKRNRISISEAAREHAVPRQTLADHIKGKYKYSGAEKILTDEEGAALVNYIKYMSQRCLPLTRAALKCFVTSIVKRSRRPPKFDIEKGPSNRWIRRFLQRQDELTLKVPETQEKGRTRMANQTVMDQHFKLLNEIVTKLGLENAPAQIFNCDETGFSGKEKGRTKVIGIKGRHSYQQQVLTNSHITAQMCVSADGRVLPTFIIFEKSLPHKNFRDGVPGNWLFGSSDSGYMDGELFKSWFEEIFIPFCGSRRPVLLILDNHDSHISIEIIEKAKDNQIELYGLPPHTTHIVQPLDVAIYGPLKGKVKDLGSSIGLFDNSALIGKAKFPALLSTAIDSICSPARIKDAFRKSGLYPIDGDAIDKTQLIPRDFQKKKDTPGDEGTSESYSTESQATVLCDSCGSVINVTVNQHNPLVAEGLIPKSLADILVPPVPKPHKPKSKKIITESRVITGENIINQLKDREAAEKQKREDIIKRKAEREQKKTQREIEKAERKRKREEKRQEKMNLIKQRQAMKLVKTIKKKVKVKQQSVNFQDVFYNHVNREMGSDEKYINAEDKEYINAGDQEETHNINSEE